MPRYSQIAEDYVARLPRGEVVDLFAVLSGAYAARGLAILLGMEEATDDEMMEWSQALIEGAGNFGWKEAPFDRADRANTAIHALLDSLQDRHRAAPNTSAFSVMLNADDPIPETQIYANIKIAIGGGINEPRDALNTTIFGLLTNPDQFEAVKKNGDWMRAFEEGVRWVAPISASSRLVMEDTEIRGCFIPKGDTVMTIQASANRDEDVVSNGEAFDVYRDDCIHQSFANGPHLCQGTHVARRAIGQIMLPVLFDRFPNASLPDPSAVIWRGFGFRGPVTLPVLLS
jgi:cytochrome P450